jgi:hypothetical protein
MIENLLSTRHQIKYFDQSNYPNKDVINSILESTYRLVPSKQNLMPYKVHVFGPEHADYKKELYNLSSIQEGPDIHKKRILREKTGNFQLIAPYVLLFEKRCPEPNESVKRRMRNGHMFVNCDPERHSEDLYMPDAALEVGMFASTLTPLCLEKGISISYTGCIPDYIIHEKFKFIEGYVFLAISLGYISENLQDQMEHARERSNKIDETKPDIKNIICWK